MNFVIAIIVLAISGAVTAYCENEKIKLNEPMWWWFVGVVTGIIVMTTALH